MAGGANAPLQNLTVPLSVSRSPLTSTNDSDLNTRHMCVDKQLYTCICTPA